jgi:hypothetical protein
MDDVARAYVRTNQGIDPLLADFGALDPDRDYALAGSFVAFLLDQGGIAPLVLFLQGCGAAPDAYEQAFVRAYGRSVRALGVEWEISLSSGSVPRRAWYDPDQWPRTLESAGGTAVAALPERSAGGSPAVVLSVGP